MEKNIYFKEQKFIIKNMRKAYKKFIKKDLETEYKGDFDIVTKLDLNIEKYLIEKIQQKFPNDIILSEEHYANTKIFGRTWVIDPIDGTNNMAQGNPNYGMQCALIVDNDIVMSVIYLPIINQMYTAVKGSGAFLNNRAIVNELNKEVKDAVISFGDFPHKRPSEAEHTLKIIDSIKDKVKRIRMFGASCIDFSFMASNKIDGIVSYTRNIWDLAPGILICMESGVKVTNLLGENYTFGDKGIIAAINPTIHKFLIETYNKTV